jgi:hypothetical protein
MHDSKNFQTEDVLVWRSVLGLMERNLNFVLGYPIHTQPLSKFGIGQYLYLVFRSRPLSWECWKYWNPSPPTMQAIFKAMIWNPYLGSCGNYSGNWTQDHNPWMSLQISFGVCGMSPDMPEEWRYILTPFSSLYWLFILNSYKIITHILSILAHFPKKSGTNTGLHQIWRVLPYRVLAHFS